MSAKPAEVPSPCVNVCQMDPQTGLCRGCLRTLAEIADWMDYTVPEKLEVLGRLDERRWATLDN